MITLTCHLFNNTSPLLQVNSSSISRTPIGNKYETNAVLEYEVNHYATGKMKVSCEANLFEVYKNTVEQLLDEEKPQIASVLGESIHYR